MYRRSFRARSETEVKMPRAITSRSTPDTPNKALNEQPTLALMFFDELLMEVTHVQIEVLVPVQAQNLFRLLLRFFGTHRLLGFRRRRSWSPW